MTANGRVQELEKQARGLYADLRQEREARQKAERRYRSALEYATQLQDQLDKAIEITERGVLAWPTQPPAKVLQPAGREAADNA